eukprot:TRINITY_DN6289_c0_g1_i10.p1 TRINITY_DN6289_c0_g1~~TRINITY_DN6289_c0_g1_i10.p1  ORF type:complete len:445 (-),score=99.42 TRINITY_DN6289_c0_g1_i10:839-2173(-)
MVGAEMLPKEGLGGDHTGCSFVLKLSGDENLMSELKERRDYHLYADTPKVAEAWVIGLKDWKESELLSVRVGNVKNKVGDILAHEILEYNRFLNKSISAEDVNITCQREKYIIERWKRNQERQKLREQRERERRRYESRIQLEPETTPSKNETTNCTFFKWMKSEDNENVEKTKETTNRPGRPKELPSNLSKYHMAPSLKFIITNLIERNEELKADFLRETNRAKLLLDEIHRFTEEYNNKDEQLNFQTFLSLPEFSALSQQLQSRKEELGMLEDTLINYRIEIVLHEKHYVALSSRLHNIRMKIQEREEEIKQHKLQEDRINHLKDLVDTKKKQLFSLASKLQDMKLISTPLSSDLGSSAMSTYSAYYLSNIQKEEMAVQAHRTHHKLWEGEVAKLRKIHGGVNSEYQTILQLLPNFTRSRKGSIKSDYINFNWSLIHQNIPP